MQKISFELKAEGYGSINPFPGTGKWKEEPQEGLC